MCVMWLSYNAENILCRWIELLEDFTEEYPETWNAYFAAQFMCEEGKSHNLERISRSRLCVCKRERVWNVQNLNTTILLSRFLKKMVPEVPGILCASWREWVHRGRGAWGREGSWAVNDSRGSTRILFPHFLPWSEGTVQRTQLRSLTAIPSNSRDVVSSSERALSQQMF